MQTQSHLNTLNLARKWRSKTFDTIVGQTLAVRMLKNSLYLNYYFPVYLLAGQRGCGKTTTARIFAAAINCKNLTQFQQDPKKYDLPCLICESCIAMRNGNHPDFIEMDAASHTGVDNVRVIIDAAALLPVLGKKKIYLIDEAHMLSKAAFNAFLKILEEPPTSVLFMLATTDSHKIIDTVKSRCFQLFFKAVNAPDLLAHLEFICSEESIAYQEEGLQLIVRQSQGSVRDAINLLEQVRFSASIVDKQTVCQILGHLDDLQLLQLFEFVCKGDEEKIVRWFSTNNLEQFRAPSLWDSFLELIRAALWQQYNQPLLFYVAYQEQLKKTVAGIHPSVLVKWMEIFYAHELLFFKTTSQHRLFETIVLQLGKIAKPSTPLKEPLIKTEKPQSVVQTPENAKAVTQYESDERWSAVIIAISQLDDPLIISIFQQGRFMGFDAQTNIVNVAFAKDFSFFNEWLENSITLWQPILQQYFGKSVQFKPHFIDEQKTIEVKQPVSSVEIKPEIIQVKPQDSQRKSYTPRYNNNAMQEKKIKHKAIDVSDKAKWPTANLLLSHFPGTIVEVQEPS